MFAKRLAVCLFRFMVGMASIGWAVAEYGDGFTTLQMRLANISNEQLGVYADHPVIRTYRDYPGATSFIYEIGVVVAAAIGVVLLISSMTEIATRWTVRFHTLGRDLFKISRYSVVPEAIFIATKYGEELVKELPAGNWLNLSEFLELRKQGGVEIRVW